MDEVSLRVDSRGRICLPDEIRKELGDVVTLKKTSKGYLLTPDKQTKFLEEFRKVISSEPKRRGKPKLVSPEEMKAIWKTKV